MFFCGNIFFIIFGSTKIQPWNDSPLKSGKTLEGKLIIYNLG